jgi:hypothetical protein
MSIGVALFIFTPNSKQFAYKTNLAETYDIFGTPQPNRVALRKNNY